MPERILTEIEGQQLALTHLDRLVYPEVGVIKAEVIKYYLNIAPYMAPHLQERPLVFTRYPDGVNKSGFFQKNAPSYLPAWMQTHAFADNKRYIMAADRASLAWLANHGCIEIHPWLSRVSSLSHPDFLVLDLDPSPANPFPQVVKVALELHYLLKNLQLEAFPKTSGGRGIHIYIPVNPRYSYNQIRDLALQIAKIIVKAMPDITTIQRMKAKRGQRIYIDCLQIGEGKTLCAPYSLRPTAKATVSTPIRWDEVADINPEDFTLTQIGGRVNQVGDLFSRVLTARQDLERVFSMLMQPIR